jgi:hypothetical protein
MDDNVDLDKIIEDLNYQIYRNQYRWWSYDEGHTTLSLQALQMALEWAFQREYKTKRALFTTEKKHTLVVIDKAATKNKKESF